MTPRKNSSAAFWATVAVAGALVAYPLSFGPACWWRSESYYEVSAYLGNSRLAGLHDSPCAPRIYWPIGWLAVYGPEPLRRSICWYATAGGKGHVELPVDGKAEWRLWPLLVTAPPAAEW